MKAIPIGPSVIPQQIQPQTQFKNKNSSTQSFGIVKFDITQDIYNALEQTYPKSNEPAKILKDINDFRKHYDAILDAQIRLYEPGQFLIGLEGKNSSGSLLCNPETIKLTRGSIKAGLNRIVSTVRDIKGQKFKTAAFCKKHHLDVKIDENTYLNMADKGICKELVWEALKKLPKVKGKERGSFSIVTENSDWPSRLVVRNSNDKSSITSFDLFDLNSESSLKEIGRILETAKKE